MNLIFRVKTTTWRGLPLTSKSLASGAVRDPSSAGGHPQPVQHTGLISVV